MLYDMNAIMEHGIETQDGRLFETFQSVKGYYSAMEVTMFRPDEPEYYRSDNFDDLMSKIIERHKSYKIVQQIIIY